MTKNDAFQNALHAALVSESVKIADVSPKNLSPDTVLNKGSRSMFVGGGVQKAHEVLAKTANLDTPAVYGGSSDVNARPFSKDHEESGRYDRTRHYVRGALAGAGTGGGLIPNLAFRKGPSYKTRLIGTAIGTAAGLADSYITDKKRKHATVLSPKLQLKASSQVARTLGHGIEGPGIKAQIGPRLIGKKFTGP